MSAIPFLQLYPFRNDVEMKQRGTNSKWQKSADFFTQFIAGGSHSNRFVRNVECFVK